ncbi:MAG: DMT family transporter [Candidatus Hodarchaeota archaeon]
MSNILIGIVLQIAGMAILNIGTVIQKKGADMLPDVHDQSLLKNLKNFLTNKPWLIGYIGIIVGTLLNLVALGFGDLSILQPLMGVGIIVQIWFCGWYLKEKIGKNEIISLLVVLIGVILVGISSRDVPQKDFPELISLTISPISIITLSILTAVAIACYAYTALKKYAHADILISTFSGLISVVNYLFLKVLIGAIFTYGLTAELFASLAAWLILVIALVTGTICFAARQVAYQHGRAVLVNNLFNAYNIALPVLLGIVILEEWIGMPVANATIQIIGVVVILIGVFLLTKWELKTKNETSETTPG